MDEISQWASRYGLTFSEHPLKTKPDLRHCHLRMPGQKGTLEVTVSSTNSVQIEVRANRQGAWINVALRSLRAQLSQN